MKISEQLREQARKLTQAADIIETMGKIETPQPIRIMSPETRRKLSESIRKSWEKRKRAA